MKSLLSTIAGANSLTIRVQVEATFVRFPMIVAHYTFLDFLDFKYSSIALTNSKEAVQHLLSLVSCITIFSISSISSIVSNTYPLYIKRYFSLIS